MIQAKVTSILRILCMLFCARVVCSGLHCKSCDKVQALSQCVTSVDCGINQVCFMEKYVTERRQVLYSGGCREKDMCPYQTVPFTLVGRRRRNMPTAEQLTCSKCCEGVYDCNLKLCGDQVNYRPPKIVTQSDKDVIYVATGQSFEIPCIAQGTPDPVYHWKLNGGVFSPSGNDGRIVQKKDEGSLHFVSHDEKDEGVYQCFANNGYGVSASRFVSIVTAKFMTYPNTPPMVNRAYIGSPVTLPCYYPRSTPPAALQWVLAGNNSWQDVRNTKRILMDSDGRLRFLNVIKSDAVAGKSYRCLATNSVTGEHRLGSEHLLEILGDDERRSPATMAWTSPSINTFMKTKTLELTCLFNGNPTPDVYWEKLRGSLSDNRTSFANFGTTLQISNLEYTDAGGYECMGINSESVRRVTKHFDVLIEAAPYWKVKPTDVNAVVNGTATFLARAEGVPKPVYTWYINGKRLDESRDPRVYQSQRLLQQDRYNLTLTQLTVDDHMNIQCNISNKHGYLFADVYLNVVP